MNHATLRLKRINVVRLPLALTAAIVVALALLTLGQSFVHVSLVAKATMLWLVMVALPGMLFVDALFGHSSARPTALEYALYAIGVGYVLLAVAMLALSYVPGRLYAWMIILGYALFVFVMLMANRRTETTRLAIPTLSVEASSLRGAVVSRTTVPWLLAGFLALLALAGFLRLTSLGYAEFHGDEARAVLRATAVIQGYDDVLMLHRKAPGEILVPTALFSLTGSLDEAGARLLFSLANLSALVGVFLLGWHMVGLPAAWTASLLFALDGYLVGFARFVQYQSIVVLLSVLSVLVAYRIYRNPQEVTRYLLLAALFLAGGLLFHFDMLVAFLPVAFLLAAAWRKNRSARKSLMRGTLVAALVAVALVALYYVPYVLHPEFSAIWDYVWNERVSGAVSPPHNHLRDVFLRTTIYGSAYYAIFLGVMTFVAFCLACWRGLRMPLRIIVLGLAAITLLPSLWRYDWLGAGAYNLSFVPYLFWLVLILWLPKMPVAERTLWFWFGVPAFVSLFVIWKPVTHIYAFFVPWMLVIGTAIQVGWTYLNRRSAPSWAALSAAVAVAAAVAVFGTYTYLVFVFHEREIMFEKWESLPRIYWLPSGVEESYGFYGFPLNNGWKAVGTLYEQGVISGDFVSNEWNEWTPKWYTRGQFRCNDSAVWFFEVDSPEPWDQDAERFHEGFQPWATVFHGDQPRMVILAKENAPVAQADRLDLAAYSEEFDASTSADFPLDYPVVRPQPTHVLDANLGNLVALEGYDLDSARPFKPGDVVDLTLHWRALTSPGQSLKVFVQAFTAEGKMVLQQDNMPVCNRHATVEWRPGERIADRHKIEVAEDAPAGTYPLIVGMYSQDTMERLPVFNEGSGTETTWVWLTDITVERESAQ